MGLKISRVHQVGEREKKMAGQKAFLEKLYTTLSLLKGPPVK
jgi:hypothetical protein